jgi:hypothetical protein
MSFPSPAPGPQRLDLRVPLDEAAFRESTAGFFGARRLRRRIATVEGVSEVLRRGLEPGEVVRRAAVGVLHGFREQLYAGEFASSILRSAVVVTDRRVLLIDVDRRGAPRDVKNQVRFPEVRRAGMRFGVVSLELADGSTLKYRRIPSADQAWLAAGIQAQALVTGVGAHAAAARSSTCARLVCGWPGQAGAALACPEPTCRTQFRDPGKAVRLSLLAPGLGSYYLGYRAIGTLEVFRSLVLLVALVVLLARWQRTPAMAFGAGAAALILLASRYFGYRRGRHLAARGLVPLRLAPRRAWEGLPLRRVFLWVVLILLFVAFYQFFRAPTPHEHATALVRQGQLDQGVAAYRAAERAGRLTDDNRARFLLALYQAGDLETAAAVAKGLAGRRIDAQLAAALRREREGGGSLSHALPRHARDRVGAMQARGESRVHRGP